MATNCPTGAPKSQFRERGPGVAFGYNKLFWKPVQKFRLDPGLYEVIISQRDISHPHAVTLYDSLGENVLVCPGHAAYNYTVKDQSLINLVVGTFERLPDGTLHPIPDPTIGPNSTGIDHFTMYSVRRIEIRMTAAEAAHEINRPVFRCMKGY